MTVPMTRTRINDLSLKLRKWRAKYKNQCISGVFSALFSILKVGSTEQKYLVVVPARGIRVQNKQLNLLNNRFDIF